MGAAPADRNLLASVHAALCDRGAGGNVKRTTTGDRLVAIELEEGPIGVAHRPAGTTDAPPPTDALALGHWAVDPPGDAERFETALGIAALNALSVGYVSWRRGDPMAALASDVERIATVGLFRPAFRKFDAVDVRVIERDSVDHVEAPPGVTASVYEPADYDAAIDGVDVLFITGSSLVYGGTSAYLEAAADVPSVVLIGATASFLPSPAFEAGATMVAGGQVTDERAVHRAIEEGLCGTDLHDRGLEKVYVTTEPQPHGFDLDEPAAGTPAEADGGP